MIHDLRHAVRTLKRAPGFTIATVVTLALGIGANSAIFSVVNAVVLKPLTFEQPDQLVQVYSLDPQGARAAGSRRLARRLALLQRAGVLGAPKRQPDRRR